MKELSLSILSGDFWNLSELVGNLIKGGADRLHMDIMDGHFVPHISFGTPVVESISRHTAIPMDVHLMVENPIQILSDFNFPGVDTVIVHHESTIEPRAVIPRIKGMGLKAGIAINPSTPVRALLGVMDQVDEILVMSVNPGKGGQRIIPESAARISELIKMRSSSGYSFIVAVDGGINRHTLEQVKIADRIVVGSAVTQARDPVSETAYFIRKLQGR